jgi:hypothetical protein
MSISGYRKLRFGQYIIFKPQDDFEWEKFELKKTSNVFLLDHLSILKSVWIIMLFEINKVK